MITAPPPQRQPDYQPSRQCPPNHQPPRPPGLSVRATILVVMAAFLALVAIGGIIAGPPDLSTPVVAGAPTPAAQVQLEPTASSGTDPFMTPVGTDQAVTAPADTGGEFTSDTPGLYGDSGAAPSCDAAALIRNLQADPAKATAWSAALGITADKISDFVTTLTPVLLRSDTAVTSYGYTDSRFPRPGRGDPRFSVGLALPANPSRPGLSPVP